MVLPVPKTSLFGCTAAHPHQYILRVPPGSHPLQELWMVDLYHGLIVIPVRSETVRTTFPLVNDQRIIPRRCGLAAASNVPSQHKAGGKSATGTGGG